MNIENFRQSPEDVESSETTPEDKQYQARKQNAEIGAKTLESESTGNVAKIDLEKTARSFIRRHGKILGMFARDTSLDFVPTPTAETFCFDARTFRVEMPTSWFASERFTENELLFANHHEIAHFIDMRNNPEAYLENFDYMRKRAEELAKKHLAKRPDSFASQAAAKSYFYKRLHDLYNVLDDIYVNNLVFEKDYFFDRGDGRKAVVSLYKKLGFGQADLRGMPLHKQMLTALLRDEMLGSAHGETVVDDKVREVLDKGIMGQKDMESFIDVHLKPHHNKPVDPKKRHEYIRVCIERKYLELLEIDLEKQEEQQENKPEDNKTEQSGDNNDSGETGDNSDSEETGDNSENNNTGEGNEDDDNDDAEDSKEGDGNGSEKDGGQEDGMDDESVSKDILGHGADEEKILREILDALKEKKRRADLSDEERAEEDAKARDKKFDEDYDISEEQRKVKERIEDEISEARREMQDFWSRLIGKSIRYRRAIVQNRKKGHLNINSTIDHWTQLTEAERRGELRDLEVYDQTELIPEAVNQPEVIEVTLLVDCSGSMEGKKVEAARKAAALLMYSLYDFNQELKSDKTQDQIKTELRTRTEVMIFGSDSEIVKPFDDDEEALREYGGKESPFEVEIANSVAITKSISRIDGIMGGTNDASPLAEITMRISDEDKKKIKAGKIKKIVFEITDGASQTPGKTARLLDELAEEGVIVIGFQIGNVTAGERESFEEIWNSDGGSDRKSGVFVGEDISQLPRLLIESLVDSLNNIII